MTSNILPRSARRLSRCPLESPQELLNLPRLLGRECAVNFVWPFCEVSAEEVDICEAEPQDVLERCQADGGVWALTDITDIESTNGICSVTALGTAITGVRRQRLF